MAQQRVLVVHTGSACEYADSMWETLKYGKQKYLSEVSYKYDYENSFFIKDATPLSLCIRPTLSEDINIECGFQKECKKQVHSIDKLKEEIAEQIRFATEQVQMLDAVIIINELEDAFNRKVFDALLDVISDGHPKTIKIIEAIYNSEIDDAKLNENTAKSINSIINNASISFMCNKAALKTILRNDISIQCPTQDNYNELFSYIFSLQFSELTDHCNDFFLPTFINDCLMPFPSLKFITHSYSTFFSPHVYPSKMFTTWEATFDCVKTGHNMTLTDFTKYKMISMILKYVGDIIPKDVGYPYRELKTNQAFPFVEGEFVKFKCGISYKSPYTMPGGILAQYNKACCIFANSTGMADVLLPYCKKSIEEDIASSIAKVVNEYKDMEIVDVVNYANQ